MSGDAAASIGMGQAAEPPARSFGARVRAVVDAGARSWSVRPRTLVAMWTLPIWLVLGAMVAALLGKEAYLWYASEDGFAETLQVLCYAVALVYAARLALRMRRDRVDRRLLALYGLLCVALLFMVGEELSWGQRIFGWGTPEVLVETNKQAETNLHNIYGVGATFKRLQMVAAGYGVILPLLVVADWKPLRRFGDRLVWLVPHWSLIPFFLPFFVWRIYRLALPNPPQSLYLVITEFNEVVELGFALGVCLFLVWQWRRMKREAAAMKATA
jgi:hypothetical protein